MPLHCAPTEIAALLPRVTYFFGVPGVGKSFLAGLLSELTGVQNYEADSDLPPDIQETIHARRPFTDAQRDELYRSIAEKITSKLKDSEKLIVSQATFKERHRRFLRERVPGLEFVWVEAPHEIVIARLKARGDLIDPEYGITLAKHFEPPPEGARRLRNVGDAALARQELLALWSHR